MKLSDLNKKCSKLMKTIAVEFKKLDTLDSALEQLYSKTSGLYEDTLDLMDDIDLGDEDRVSTTLYDEPVLNLVSALKKADNIQGASSKKKVTLKKKTPSKKKVPTKKKVTTKKKTATRKGAR